MAIGFAAGHATRLDRCATIDFRWVVDAK